MFTAAFLLTGCIHEYPEAEALNPTSIEVALDLDLNLKWNQKTGEPVYQTKADKNIIGRRITVLISRNGKQEGKDIFYLTEDEFNVGNVKHKMTFSLEPREYEIAVWCDVVEGLNRENGYYDLSELPLVKSITAGINYDSRQTCGFASSRLDLRQYSGQWGAKVIKQMKLEHPGARFEITTTDIQKFLEAQQVPLLNGESYTLTLSFGDGTASGIDIMTGIPFRDEFTMEWTDDLELPFTTRTQLQIAGGFIFCSDEENISMSLIVHNSARLIVVRTPQFRFPVKRGLITKISGDFLSETFSNTITVDNIWEGEIVIELE